MIICTGALPWIVLDLLQWKTQCLFTYIRSGFVNHYFPVESPKLYLSRPSFVNVAKGVFDLQIDKKKKKHKFVLNE
jgi:hypothetical protein